LDADPEIDPGLRVQFPDGKPDISILPVANEQVGCVTEAIIGVDGVAGCALITASAEIKEVHPEALVTVKA